MGLDDSALRWQMQVILPLLSTHFSLKGCCTRIGREAVIQPQHDWFCSLPHHKPLKSGSNCFSGEAKTFGNRDSLAAFIIPDISCARNTKMEVEFFKTKANPNAMHAASLDLVWTMSCPRTPRHSRLCRYEWGWCLPR